MFKTSLHSVQKQKKFSLSRFHECSSRLKPFFFSIEEQVVNEGFWQFSLKKVLSSRIICWKKLKSDEQESWKTFLIQSIP